MVDARIGSICIVHRSDRVQRPDSGSSRFVERVQNRRGSPASGGRKLARPVYIMPHVANSHYIASMLESFRVARSAHGREIFIARSLHSEPVEVRSGPR